MTRRVTPVGCSENIARNGHTVVRGLGTAAELAAARPAINAAVEHRRSNMAVLHERNTYDRAFIQAGNLWHDAGPIHHFVTNPRYAQASAELLGVPAVRLYHDQALFKEPGGGRTPWHQDQVYWPLDNDLAGGGTITMWMALTDIDAAVGSMTFASGSHLRGDLGGGVIGDKSESALDETVRATAMFTETYGAMSAGDATFHLGWTLHRAGPNPSSMMREVMTVIYFADGTRIGRVDSPARQLDHRFWLGGLPVGELADGPGNPVLWPAALA